MKNSNTVFDCNILVLPKVIDRAGNLTSVHNNVEIPFKIKRVFYIYDVPGGESRGAHALKSCHQILISVCGAFEVLLDDGNTKRIVQLNRPDHALHVKPMVWASEINFISGTVCLVLTSHLFNEEDYIRDYEEFQALKTILS